MKLKILRQVYAVKLITASYWYSGCGGNFTSPTGNIVSKNYPEPYPAHSDCTWKITVETGRTVELTFTDFAVEGHSTCNYDNVMVRYFHFWINLEQIYQTG